MKVLDLPSLRKKMAKIDSQRQEKIEEYKKFKDSKRFRKVVELWAEEKTKLKILSDKQRMAIYLMTDMHHNFSMNYIATRLDISNNEFAKWRNDPYFLSELNKEITRRSTYMRLHAFRNVNRAISRGDMKSTWKYLEMTGDLKKNVEVVDRTGESELSDEELNLEINKLLKASNN